MPESGNLYPDFEYISNPIPSYKEMVYLLNISVFRYFVWRTSMSCYFYETEIEYKFYYFSYFPFRYVDYQLFRLKGAERRFVITKN